MAELIWDGKYKDGKKVAPVKISLPFQTVETIYESAQQRQKSLDLYASGQKTEWRNRLIWGDKKYVLPSLLDEFAGKVNLIYIDPPFDTGADFSFTTTVPESDESFTKEPSLIEQKAYRDTWGVSKEEKYRGVQQIDKYLKWFYETAVLLRELLADDGSIYIHLDWHVGHYAKAILDEIFGENNLLREVIWSIETSSGFKAQANMWIRGHDTILVYKKTTGYVFNKQFLELEEKTIRRYDKTDENGKRYKIYYQNGQERIVYLDKSKGRPITDVWSDIIGFQTVNRGPEYLNYPTQKPEALINRIIIASSNPSDLILDCFIGSGTTAAMAEKLGRRWIACDLGRFAIHTTRKRLLQIDGCKPFVVQNLGKYERQAWRGLEFENAKDIQEKEAAYRKFILDLYRAEPISGHNWLHGIKAGKMVHVGSVDAPVTFDDVKSICAEVWKAAGKGKDSPKKAAVDILGWDFGFEVNETAKQLAAEAKVEAKFKHIPREVMERQAVDAGDIHFYELAALDVKLTVNKMAVAVELTDFMLPQDDVPEDIRKAVKKWSQWIDYWAIDWDYKDDTFHNMWQSYRTKKSPDLQYKMTNKYENKGKYTIVIKVIDILGNDTTKTVDVEIK